MNDISLNSSFADVVKASLQIEIKEANVVLTEGQPSPNAHGAPQYAVVPKDPSLEIALADNRLFKIEALNVNNSAFLRVEYSLDGQHAPKSLALDMHKLIVLDNGDDPAVVQAVRDQMPAILAYVSEVNEHMAVQKHLARTDAPIVTIVTPAAP